MNAVTYLILTLLATVDHQDHYVIHVSVREK